MDSPGKHPKLSTPRPARPPQRPAPAFPPQWIRRLEVISILLLATGLVVFLRLARYVGLGEVDELDRWILVSLRNPAEPSDPLGPPWFEELVRDFTALGGFGAITFFTLATAGGLALAKKGRTAVTALVAIVGGVAISLALKALFD